MRRGIFSFITYLLYTLFWGSISIWLYDAILKSDGSGGGVVAVALIMGVAAVLSIGGLIAMILKLVHMATRWKLFGIICILIDGYLLYTLIGALIGVGAMNGVTLVLLIPIGLSSGSLISNALSLGF